MSAGNAVPAGGSFVTSRVLEQDSATPERFHAEQRQFFDTALQFSLNEVEPKVEQIEHKKPNTMVELMRKAADLGLFLTGIPEAFGGLGADETTGLLVAEALSRVGSFAVTYGAHTGIGTLPIVHYGTRAQQERYLPRLGKGELLGAYALSEPGSGSDALGAKATARLSADGTHYVLSGTKQWITNAAWANLFTVFAQVDGSEFTAFLVERKTPGVSIGHEERKLGIRGSSTCQLILDDVHVPVENVLGEIGKGHRIAFNILNLGRLKLGGASIGGAKGALGHGVRYAKERRQFKKPIASFGLIREKLAQAMVLIYAGESMAYRTTGLIDARTRLLDKSAPDFQHKAAKAIEEFTIECSILKVFGSEAAYRICDQMLQIHGGNGYTEDYPMERFLRDARINLIFEGTNEINRLIVPATLLKRALQGRVPLMEFTQQVVEELSQENTDPGLVTGALAHEVRATDLAKRAIVYAASYAAQKYLDDLKEKQRILGTLADCIIDVFGMDCVVLRAHQAEKEAPEQVRGLHRALAQLFCFDARSAVFQRLHRIAMMMADGDELELLYANLKKLDRRYRIDYMTLEEQAATACIEADGYPLRHI